MKKQIVIAILVLLASAGSVSAETVRTCSSVYGGGEVCGETTTNVTVEHKVIETGANDSQMFKLLVSLAGAAIVATGLYKLTYKSFYHLVGFALSPKFSKDSRQNPQKPVITNSLIAIG